MNKHPLFLKKKIKNNRHQFALYEITGTN